MDRKKQAIIIFLLIAMGILVRLTYRYPHHPDHYTWLNYTYSVLKFGYVTWMLHPLSLIGYYPLSIPTGIEFFSASMSLLTGMTLQDLYYPLAIMIGLIGGLNLYVMMRRWTSEATSLLSALILLTMAFFTKDTSFTASNRILNIVFYPLFVLFLFKIHDSWHISKARVIKYIIIESVLAAMMIIVHRLSQFLLIFLLSYALAQLMMNWERIIDVLQKTSFYKRRKQHYEYSKLHLFIDVLVAFLLLAGYATIKSKIAYVVFALFTVAYYFVLIFKKEKEKKKLFFDIIFYMAVLVLAKAADLALRSRLLVQIAKYLPDMGYAQLAALGVLLLLIGVAMYLVYHFYVHSIYETAFRIFDRVVTKVIMFVETRPHDAISIGLFMVFVFMVYATFTGRAMISMDPSHYYDSFLLKGESSVVVFINWVFNLNNNLSILIMFSFVGIFYLFLKRGKTFYDYFFIFVVLGFSQFVFDWEYVRLYMNPIYALTIAIGLTYVVSLLLARFSPRAVTVMLVGLLCLHFVVSGVFVQREYLLEKLNLQTSELDLYEDEYYIPASAYLRDDTGEGYFSVITSTPRIRTNMIAHYGNIVDAVDAQSIFINWENFNITQISYQEIKDSLLSGDKVTSFYYLKDWILPGTYYHGRHIFNLLIQRGFDEHISQRIIQDYRISYFVDGDVPIEEKENYFRYIEPRKNKIYSSDALRIYDLHKGKN